MWDFLKRLFDSDLMPHGQCWAWDPWIVGSNVLSDVVIAFSYLLISLTLLYLIRKRRDVAFNWMVVLFGAFIFCCGATHAMEVYNTWHAVFRAAGVVKAVTALVSFATAILLLRILPLLMALPSLSQVQDTNATLLGEVEERRQIEAQLRSSEAALRSAGEELERTVESRTQELVRANRKLEGWAAELARSNKDLERFAFVASHDLQEPLRMVITFTQLLSERCQGKLDPESEEFMGFAVTGAQNMHLLIQDLLRYAQIRREAHPMEPTPLDEVFHRAMANLGAALLESRAQITRDPLPVVLVDRVQWIQVFQNLLGNAIKFRDWRPLEIHVGVRKEDKEWLFSVRDNGIGIDSRYLERVFAMFQRLHPKGEYPGTGIGLSICQQIVERHGGRIWAESVQGEGSTFFFTLPAVEEEVG